MTYATIQPPFTLKFREMPKEALKRYFQWFLKVIPERIGELSGEVQRSPRFDSWRSDYAPDSLGVLGYWFADQVETRPRTEQEIREIKNRGPYVVEVGANELTNRTFSLAIDVGMYFGEVLLRNYPSLRWRQYLDDKAYADYGQPVIVEFLCGPLNPVRISISFAYGVARKQRTGERLREIHDYWIKQLQ